MRDKGFTLIEIIIVVAITAVVGGSLLFVDMGNFRGDSFRAEISTLVVALQTARMDALNNVHQSAHGVKIKPPECDGYVVFEGESYLSSMIKECTKENYDINFSENPEIVFSPLSGDSNFEGDIIISDPKRPAQTITVSLNYEGKIAY